MRGATRPLTLWRQSNSPKRFSTSQHLHVLPQSSNLRKGSLSIDVPPEVAKFAVEAQIPKTDRAKLFQDPSRYLPLMKFAKDAKLKDWERQKLYEDPGRYMELMKLATEAKVKDRQREKFYSNPDHYLPLMQFATEAKLSDWECEDLYEVPDYYKPLMEFATELQLTGWERKRLYEDPNHYKPLMELVTKSNFTETERLRLIANPERYKAMMKFAQKAGLDHAQRRELYRNSRDFVSRPNNVPPQCRTNVYLPKPFDIITLYRTPHLPPKYASFWVPLWFNKLDMKSYLKSGYGVDILHVRSYVKQQKVTRRAIGSRGFYAFDQGRLVRAKAKKKMTVELVEPFVWPEEVEDLSPWEKDLFYDTAKEQLAAQTATSPQAAMKPNKEDRKSIAEQAQELLAGKGTWKPTWQSIPADARVMAGLTSPRV